MDAVVPAPMCAQGATDAETVNRQLLRWLASPPHPHARGSAVGAVTEMVGPIRDVIVRAHARREAVVSVSTLRCWRDELDTVLVMLSNAAPEVWRAWARPGTWLDQHLRLRKLLAHLCRATEQRGTVSVPYAEMDVAGHLWNPSTKDEGTAHDG